jgi:hypothetical protein
MMRSLFFFFTCAVVVVSVVSVADVDVASPLDAAAEVGEAVKEKTGGFFSALMTSGSFMMMQAGAFEEEEETKQTIELGESYDAGTSSFDFSQCISEGGTKNCALCSDQTEQKDNNGNIIRAAGALRCDLVANQNFANGKASSDCRDSEVYKNGLFIHGTDTYKGLGSCQEWKISNQGAHILVSRDVTLIDREFPGFATSGNKQAIVITKMRVGHPHMASKSVGIAVFKRVVMHRCQKNAGCPSGASKGASVGDSVKIGYCVNCDMSKLTGQELKALGVSETWTPFSHTKGFATDTEKNNFLNKCFKHAFNSDGSVKDRWACTGQDMILAQSEIGAF